MKIANSIKVTVFAKEEEDSEAIKNKFLGLFPFDLSKEKIELKEQIVKGFEEKEMKIIEVLLEKERHIEAFLKKLNEEMSDDIRDFLSKQLESRLDDECNFFLRFSKDKLMLENDLWLTDQGNCFHIKIDVAAFPKKKENALPIIRNIFKLKGEEE